jgi:hypothetical protein
MFHVERTSVCAEPAGWGMLGMFHVEPEFGCRYDYG